jgi:hypothetical protein
MTTIATAATDQHGGFHSQFSAVDNSGDAERLIQHLEHIERIPKPLPGDNAPMSCFRRVLAIALWTSAAALAKPSQSSWNMGFKPQALTAARQ